MILAPARYVGPSSGGRGLQGWLAGGRSDWEAFSLPDGQGWAQVALLGLAVVLCALIGMERELRNKAAGLRTHTLVGLGAALLVLVSKYGFGDVLEPNHVMLDPSRVAAQIVSGIGFIGGGVIFVRRDLVRGLTTAAVVWLAAAVGMACGAGLPVLAVTVTAGHFVVIYGFTWIGRRLPTGRGGPAEMRLTYADGEGALRRTLELSTERGFSVADVRIERARRPTAPHEVSTVSLRLQGKGDVAALAAEVGEVPGVVRVSAGSPDYPSE